MTKKKLKVCWISAGISSFMAGYLAGDVDEWIYIDIADQHPDLLKIAKKQSERKSKCYDQRNIEM